MNKKTNLPQFFMTPDGIVCYQGDDEEEIKKLEELQRKVMDDNWERKKFLRSVPKIPKMASYRRKEGGKVLYYLLGKTANDTKVWLEAPEYNCCGWHTRFGQVCTFTGRGIPETAKDMASFSHFNLMFLEGDIFNSYKMLLCGGVTLEDKEIWTLLELFKEAYILEEYYEMMYIQGAHISKIPEDIKDKVLNTSEMNRIENEALPAILKKIESLLTL